MDGAGANMCKAVNIDGVAVKATFVSRVCVGGKDSNPLLISTVFLKYPFRHSFQTGIKIQL